MRIHRNVFHSTRFEELATALGLNVALAGMLGMTLSAFGLLDGWFLWLFWPIMAGLMSCLTMRSVCRVLAPLFWRGPSSCR